MKPGAGLKPIGPGSGLSKGELSSLTKNTNYDKSELLELQKEFEKQDADNSGELDKEEFQALFSKRMVGASPQQLNLLFEMMDSDKSNTISFKELATSLSTIGKGDTKGKLEYMFDLYDRDGNGDLNTEEVRTITENMMNVAKALGRDENAVASFIDRLMKKLDTDKDGSITKEEWVAQGLKTPSLLTLLAV